MKKTTIAIAVTLAGLVTVTQTAPKDSTWYTGVRLGWSQPHDINNNHIDNNSPTHESQLGIGTFGSYQVNPYVGFGMDYNWLGRMPYKGGEQNGAFRTQGAQLTAKLGYPITDNLDVYTHLGGVVQCANARDNDGFKDHDTGVSPVFAGGAEYAVTPEITTRLEHQWVNNVGDANTVGDCPDNGLLSVGVFYRFGQQEEAAPVVVAPAPTPEIQTKHLTLKSDVLLNPNKATLKPEGQQTLNQMYSQLGNLGPKDGSIVVLGFTDHTGSDTYNQGPSEKRAQSAVDYLIFKGIPSDKISARGMGESNPITGNTCNDVKARAILVDCLAPDYHVEIEVKGIKDVVTQPQA